MRRGLPRCVPGMDVVILDSDLASAIGAARSCVHVDQQQAVRLVRTHDTLSDAAAAATGGPRCCCPLPSRVGIKGRWDGSCKDVIGGGGGGLVGGGGGRRPPLVVGGVGRRDGRGKDGGDQISHP